MIKNKYLFYLLSFTWGLPMTLIGCLAAVVLLITGHKPHQYGYCCCFEAGYGWGGLSLGFIIFVSKNSSDRIKAHEHGHAIQNCLFGPLMPFVVGLPSVIRYWCREWLARHNWEKYSKLSEYDSVWFEGSASMLGNKFMDWYNTK